jgi:hypothetical protein
MERTKMKKLFIALFLAIPCTMQCMDDSKSAECCNQKVDFSFYAGLDSYIYHPIELEQERQYLLHMARLKHKYMAMSNEELEKIQSSNATISSMDETERRAFAEIYNQKHLDSKK